VFVSLGIWAVGILVFTLLTKVAVAIELGVVRDRLAPPTGAAGAGASR
jgi:hypothetical protein